MDGLWNSGIV